MASHKRQGDDKKQENNRYGIGDFLTDNGQVIGYLLTAVFITLLAVSTIGDLIKLFIH